MQPGLRDAVAAAGGVDAVGRSESPTRRPWPHVEPGVFSPGGVDQAYHVKPGFCKSP